jgi:hypothetical protein
MSSPQHTNGVMPDTSVFAPTLGWTEGGSVSHDGDILGLRGGWGTPGCSFFGSCKIKEVEVGISYVGISSLTQSWTFQRNRLGCRVCIDEGGIANRGWSRIRQGKLGYKIATGSPPHHQNPRVLGCWLSGGGDQGDFGEKSARPKPCSPSGNLGLVAREVQKKDLIVDMMASSSKG